MGGFAWAVGGLFRAEGVKIRAEAVELVFGGRWRTHPGRLRVDFYFQEIKKSQKKSRKKSKNHIKITKKSINHRKITKKKSKNHKKIRKNQKVTKRSKNQKISYNFFGVLYPSGLPSSALAKGLMKRNIENQNQNDYGRYSNFSHGLIPNAKLSLIKFAKVLTSNYLNK